MHNWIGYPMFWMDDLTVEIASLLVLFMLYNVMIWLIAECLHLCISAVMVNIRLGVFKMYKYRFISLPESNKLMWWMRDGSVLWCGGWPGGQLSTDCSTHYNLLQPWSLYRIRGFKSNSFRDRPRYLDTDSMLQGSDLMSSQNIEIK